MSDYDDIDSLDIEEVIQIFNKSYNEIVNTELDTFKLFKIFDLNNYEVDIKSKLYMFLCIKRRLVKENLYNEEFMNKTSKVFGTLYYLEQSIKNILLANVFSNSEYDSQYIDQEIFSYLNSEETSLTPYQRLIDYLLSELRDKTFKRQGDQCMKKVYNSKNKYTFSWKPEISISDFVYKVTSNNYNVKQWLNATSSQSNISSAINYLKNVNDYRFLDIIKDRKLFSFNNCIYETCIKNERGMYEDKIYFLDSPEISKISNSNRIACNYTDTDLLVDYKRWEDIPTPAFQSILDYQNFPKEVCKWMYIFIIGRMLHEVSDLDCWQVMPFLKGRAKSGKSTILTQVTKKLFHPVDTGVLSNNVEKKFGLSAFKDKFLFIAPEIKGDIGLEQCDFQTIVSGEDTSIPEKFKTAKSVVWKVPCAMAGNEPPNYKDNQGSVSRRMIVFNFTKTVKNGDTQLGKKLELELPLLLVKGNRAYLEAVNKYGKKDIWSVLPDYFSETKKDIAQQTNSLQSFLNSSKVIIDPEKIILQKHFVQEYNMYCSEHNFKREVWKADYFSTPFEENNITIIKRETFYDEYSRKQITGNWFKGVCIKIENFNPDISEDLS